jgi:hypothetical protein
MIVKKVKNPRKSASKAMRVSRLVDYITDPEHENNNEKCLYAGARGFISDDYVSQKAEMLALSQEAVRSRDTINHYVLSWHEGERPTPEQVEAAVTIFLDELGLSGHQAMYGLHADTDNIHLHIAVNRVHPDTLKVIKPNRGFDIEAAHRAIARIEEVQGWQRERNGRYQVLENGDLARGKRDVDVPRQPEQAKRDMEQRTGEKSAERIAIEEAAPIIKQAATWRDLHEALAQKGMRYEKSGSGAMVFVGEVAVKASRADRAASLGKLQARLGPYEAARRMLVKERAPQPVIDGVPGWDSYIAARHAHYAEKANALAALKASQQQERETRAARRRQERAHVLKDRWRGRGELRNAFESLLAAERAADKAAMLDAQRATRSALRHRFRPFPDFEQWQRERQHPELAEQWRFRANAPQQIRGERSAPAVARDIRDYSATVHDDGVHYRRNDQAEAVPSFVDKGREIDIYAWRERASVLAALQVAEQKWSNFIICGNAEYTKSCIELAVEHGFEIGNPELQEAIAQERQRVNRLAEKDAVPSVERAELRLFEAYHAALGAERYRVTAIKLDGDGGKMAFALDKEGGVSAGFTPQQIADHTAEMQRLQQRGENIYYTPLSATHHFILVDDLDKAGWDRLLRDGFAPAVVLESSPGNYQAILKVPKLGGAYDRDIGNALAAALNRNYGDPKLSGAVHPHRAPGYQNRKPLRQRGDGSYPTVGLVATNGGECARTLALCWQLAAQLDRSAARPSTLPNELPTPNAELTESVRSALEACRRHHADVLKRHGDASVDRSRVDAMVAVRLRVTGHAQHDIQAALREFAPTSREQQHGRNWDDYARRTAAYAFGASGSKQATELAKYLEQWKALEQSPQSEKTVERSRGISR